MKTLVKITLAAVTFALTCSVAGAHNGGDGGHFGGGGGGHFGGVGGFGHSPGGSPGHFYSGPGGFFGYDYYPWGWYGYGPDYGPPDYPHSSIYDGGSAFPREVQRELASLGFYAGPIDGIIGPATRAAIRRYQAKHGLPVTGFIDRKLIRSLGIE